MLLNQPPVDRIRRGDVAKTNSNMFFINLCMVDGISSSRSANWSSSSRLLQSLEKELTKRLLEDNLNLNLLRTFLSSFALSGNTPEF